jgi:hypothetical protein
LARLRRQIIGVLAATGRLPGFGGSIGSGTADSGIQQSPNADPGDDL